MKNSFLTVVVCILCLILGFLFGKETSNINRYFFKSGNPPYLVDTKTGDVFVKEDNKIIKVNYKEAFKNQNNKTK